MAKNSFSTKRSLKRLFSKSELNLKESTEKNESDTRIKTLNLFKWKRKRNSSKEGSSVDLRAETHEADSLEGNEGQDGLQAQPRSSIYATVPRSKKGQLSQSETDLHKPKRFPTFSLGWKKKKKADFSQAATSTSAESEVRASIWEQENEYEAVPEQTSASQPACHGVENHKATPPPVPITVTDQSQVQDSQNDWARSNMAESMETSVPTSVCFMPANVDSASILYIDDDSDKDGYQTPPESPDFNTKACISPEINPKISSTNSAIPKTQNISIETKALPGKSYSIGQKLPEVVETDFRNTDSTLSPADTSTAECWSSMLSDDSKCEPTAVAGQLPPNIYSLTKIGCDMDHSLTLTDPESEAQKKSKVTLDATITDSTLNMETTEKAKVSLKGQMESNNTPTTFSTLVSPQNSLFNPPEQSSSHLTENASADMGYSSRTRHADVRDVSIHSREISLNIPDYCSITDDTTQVTPLSAGISTPEFTVSHTESSQNNKEIMDPGSLSTSANEASGGSILPFPLLLEIGSSTTDVFSYTPDHHMSEALSVPVDSLLTSGNASAEITDSKETTHAVLEQGCRGDEYVQLQEASSICSPRLAPTNSRTFDPETATIVLTESPYMGSNDITGPNYNPDLLCPLTSTPVIPELSHSRLETNLVEQASPEPSVTSSFSSDRFNEVTLNALPFKNISATTDHLPVCPITCDQSPSSLPQCQEANICKQIHLQTNKVGGGGEEHQLVVPEPVSGSKPKLGYTSNGELAQESRTLVSNFQSVISTNDDVYKPVIEKHAPETDGVVETAVEVQTHEYEVELSSDKKRQGQECFSKNQQTDTVEEIKYTEEKMLESIDLMIKTKPHNIQMKTDKVEESENESEVRGKVFWQASYLATPKLEAPVQQARASVECAAASPWSSNSDASITSRSQSSHPDLAVGSRPSLLSGWPVTQQEEASGGGARESTVSFHEETDDNSAPEHLTYTTAHTVVREDAWTPTTVSAGVRDPGPPLESNNPHAVETTTLVLPVAGGILQCVPRSEEEEDIGSTKAEATVASSAHKEPPVHADEGEQGGLSSPNLLKSAAPHGVEKLSSSPERGTSTAGIIVLVREFALDKGGKESETAGASALSNRLPVSAHTSSGGRFFHTFPVLSTVTQEFETESPIESGSETEMSSGFTLTLRSRGGPGDGDELKKVHKLSLVGDSGGADISVPFMESSGKEDGRIPETGENGASWRFLREDFRFTPEQSPPPAKSDTVLVNNATTYTHSSLSSTEYEPALFSSLSFSPETQQKAPPSAVSLDTASSPGNSSFWYARSKVQQGSLSEAGRRSWAEFATPAEGRETESEAVITNAGLDSHTQLVSGSEHADDSFSGVFTATRVELLPSPTDIDSGPGLAPTLRPRNIPSEMETLVDTLRSMGSAPRNRTLPRASIQPFSSLPSISEDSFSAAPATLLSPTVPKETPITLPLDLGLNWNSKKDMRSPFTMMKEQLGSEGTVRTLSLPSRASALSSIVMRKSSLPDLGLEEGPHLNGGSVLGASRLDNSLLFSRYRMDQPDGSDQALGQRKYRAASLPDIDPGHERLSGAPKGFDLLSPGVAHYERMSLFTSPPHSLTGITEADHISRALPILQSPPMEGGTFTSTTPSSLLPESPTKYPAPPSLQRSLSVDSSPVGQALCTNGGLGFSNNHHATQEREFKYRAFPDAYRTKEKEHGKLNPRPGKMLIYDQAGLCGEGIEVQSDVMDATAWELPETIYIRVVRGGWVLYEKPDFKGQKIALDEGDMELTNPFGPQDNDQHPAQNGTVESGESSPGHEPASKKFVIGSLRRAVRDYSVPEICLFPEENAEGKKVIFRDTSDDARIYGFPIKANSIIINAGLWLVFAEPFFQGIPRVLEVGGFPTPASWSSTEPYVSSLHPLKIGEPRVEKHNDPKLVIYEKPYFTGKSREIYTNARDFITRESPQQTAFMYNAGSIKVIGGIWVGYEKEGFRGHQYLLEEGDYCDWRVWGGSDSELRSVRVIRTDLTEPMLVMFEMPNEEEDAEEERTFEVMEAIPDVELFGFRKATRSIHVLSGAWVAYSHVDYSGNQYVLEKGLYRNCVDWGAEDNNICSIQPILRALAVGPVIYSELLLYSEPGFQGLCHAYSKSHESLPGQPAVQSCRVMGGSWVLYDDADFTGNQYVLSEGDYVNLTSMGCPNNFSIRSVKSVPMLFAVPSITLFGLECFEGREITLDTEVSNMMAEGFNPHFLSVRVNGGCWVLYEHNNYRGRQFLLEPMEITNWHKFSSLSSIGSLYPIRSKQKPFRIRYKDNGFFMSVQGGMDTRKSGRVVVSEHVECMSDIWFYQNGLIKNKLAENMSLQVMGNAEPGSKVVLWSETRTSGHMWSAKLVGNISSLTFPGLVLDVKGGKTYDKEYVIVRNEDEENPRELWEVEFI